MMIAVPASESKTQYYVNSAYVRYAKEAGLEPIVTTPMNDVDAISSSCEGMILPGGIDVDPTFYGEDNESSFSADLEKDNFERSLINSFLEARKPIFGICRGFQLLAREYIRANPDEHWIGFCQHVDRHSLADSLSLKRSAKSHCVDYSERLYGGRNSSKTKTMFVNSMHHQCLLAAKKVPASTKTNLKVLAGTSLGLRKKDKDCFVVEAFEITSLPSKIMAVQWHPEELNDLALIQSFFGVKEAEKELERNDDFMEVFVRKE
jgi:putative glutamine amidotransferase